MIVSHIFQFGRFRILKQCEVTHGVSNVDVAIESISVFFRSTDFMLSSENLNIEQEARNCSQKWLKV